jgi:hypothetical protein
MVAAHGVPHARDVTSTTIERSSHRKGNVMRLRIRLGVGTAVVASALALGGGPALADAGAPGTTFPEQPTGHEEVVCSTLVSNPSQGGVNDSATATGIKVGIITDACFGG